MHTPSRSPLFENRYDAGSKLAAKLLEYKGKDVIVLAIPNGGVPVAVPVALALGADLDIVVARKLPIPLLPEGGFGAVADDGTTIFNESVLKSINLDEHQINYQVNKVRNDIRQRSLIYRNNRTLSVVKGKTAIIVDDGLASGYTMLAAVESVKRRGRGAHHRGPFRRPPRLPSPRYLNPPAVSSPWKRRARRSFISRTTTATGILSATKRGCAVSRTGWPGATRARSKRRPSRRPPAPRFKRGLF